MRRALIQAMAEKKVSSSELGRAIGVSKQAISQYIHGKCSPNLANSQAIADYLGVDNSSSLWKVEHNNKNSA